MNDICIISPHQHVEYLQEMINLAPGLDYKCLIAKHSSNNLISSLKDHLDESNVVQLTKLVTSIPYQVNGQ